MLSMEVQGYSNETDKLKYLQQYPICMFRKFSISFLLVNVKNHVKSFILVNNVSKFMLVNGKVVCVIKSLCDSYNKHITENIVFLFFKKCILRQLLLLVPTYCSTRLLKANTATHAPPPSQSIESLPF